MNKIYKVVWNKARNCYVVASELAKSSSRGTKVVAAVLAVSVMSTLGGDIKAFAENVVVDQSSQATPAKNTIAGGSSVTLVGTGNEVNGIDNNEVFGNGNKIITSASYTEKTQNVGIFGALNSVTDADIMYVTGYENEANKVNITNLTGWKNSIDSVMYGIVNGNSNTVNNAMYLSLVGSENIVKGAAASLNQLATKDVVVGVKNEVTNSSNASVIGSENTVENTKTAILMGDKRKLTAANNSIILGSADQIMTTNKAKVVVLGANANSAVEGGVALGADSVADRISADLASRYIGYDPAGADHSSDTTGTWKSKLAAVSVGAAGKTRQITNVAAGTELTDAVNVAQLKALKTGLESSAVHYYSVNDAGHHTNNYNNDGAEGSMALAAGAGATANGTASTVTGSFSRVDGDGVNGFTGGFQGATASAYGAFNTIGAKSGVQFDGVANSIIGVANKTENANAALIFGAGNKVTNSYRPVDMASVAPLASGLQTAMATGNTDEMIDALGSMVKTSGGAVLAIGGANTVDHALLSKVVGVGNKLTGAAGAESKLNMIDGFGNEASNVNRVTVIGSKNVVGNTDDAIVMGDYRKLAGANNSVLIGSGAEGKVLESFGKGVVAVGYGANATKSGGVAVGQDASGKGLGAVAVGQGSQASLDGDIAIGKSAKTYDNQAGYSIAIGQEAKTMGHQSIAMGYRTESAQDSVVVGNNAKAEGLGQSVVVGVGASSKKEGAVSVGINASVASISGTAVGRGANVTAFGGVALGADSVADREGFTSAKKGVFSEFDLNGKTAGAVSVGKADKLRQIINVGDATEDTDAVNLRQLKALKTGLESSAVHYYSVKSTDQSAGSNYKNDGAKGDNSLAAGVKANTMSHNSVAIGMSATIKDSNGKRGSGDIAIGNNSYIDNYVDQGGSIAIGQNARVENMAGNQERLFAFGQTTFSGYPSIPADPSKEAGGIAIGENTFARTGSLMVGTHNYKGKLGDADIDSANTRATGINVNATTLGTNSYNQGAFSTVTGTYSIISGKYNGSNWSLHAGQNFGATITGSLNSIESATSSSTYSGIANSIVGVANRSFNSNGALIFGAGNEITNSITSISAPTDGGNSAQDLQKSLMEKVKASNSGGATLAIGGGNKADYTQASQMIGVNNTLTGTSGAISKYNMINGYKNTAGNVSNVSVIGSENTVENAKKVILLGDKRKLTAANNSVILGSADQTMTTDKEKVVVLGANANSTVEGGVALGADSVADREGFTSAKKGVFSEFDLNGKTAGAVSVGKADKLRQIINVGDATEDTDAVNLRQLKAVKDSLNTTITENSVHYYSAKSDKQAAGSNYANDGAKAADSMVIGINSSSEGVNSTVLGNNNKLTGVKNPSAPWNNSIVVGQNIEVEGVNNAVFATDYHNYDNKLTKVFGEQNTVLGVGNLVGYTAVQNGTEWEYTKKGIGSDQNVAVGMTNTVNGGSVVVGTSSEADDLGTSIGHGNAIIGMNDGGGQRGVALGNDLKVKGEEAVAIGNESEAVSDWSIAMGSKSKARGVYSLAIGKDSVAEKDFATAVGFGAKANLENSVALGSWSIASTDKGMAGYDPATKAASTDASATWKSTAAAVSVGDKAQGITRQITNVAAGTEDTDAVNVAQLKKLQETVNNTAGEAAKHSTVVAGDYVQVVEGTNAAGGKEYTISGPQLTSADGTVKITDKVENGKKVGYNLSVDTSAISGEINKGMNFAGDTGAAVNKKLGETLAIKGGATELTEGNIGVEAKDGALNVKLAKNVKGVETLEVKEKITVGETVIGKDSVTTKEIKAGDTTVNNDGMKINNGPSITKDNVDMNNQQIHNVKEGTASSDAATVGQVRNITDRLGGRVDKVGAGAAALAALHPVDFDADDKLDIAAGWGNYRGENALALGAFYRPDERTLFSIGGTFGNGENMVNAGFTFKLDRRAENGGIRPITSKAALVKEVKLLRTDNEALRKDNEEIKKDNMEMRERMQRMEEQLAQLLKK